MRGLSGPSRAQVVALLSSYMAAHPEAKDLERALYIALHDADPLER